MIAIQVARAGKSVFVATVGVISPQSAGVGNTIREAVDSLLASRPEFFGDYPSYLVRYEFTYTPERPLTARKVDPETGVYPDEILDQEDPASVIPDLWPDLKLPETP